MSVENMVIYFISTINILNTHNTLYVIYRIRETNMIGSYLVMIYFQTRAMY